MQRRLGGTGARLSAPAADAARREFVVKAGGALVAKLVGGLLALALAMTVAITVAAQLALAPAFGPAGAAAALPGAAAAGLAAAADLPHPVGGRSERAGPDHASGLAGVAQAHDPAWILVAEAKPCGSAGPCPPRSRPRRPCRACHR